MYLEPDFSLFSSNAGDSSGQKGIAMSGSSLIVWPAGLPTRRRKLIRTMAGAAVAVLVAVLGLAGAPQANAGINGTFYLAAVDNTGIIGVKEGTPTMPFTLEASGAQAAVAWDSGHGMTLAVLDANGNVTAKQNTSSWLSEMSGASQVAVTSDPGLGPTLAVVQNGTVYLKQGFIDGAFTQVWASGAKQIAIASDSVRGVLVAVLTDNGDVWAAQDFDLNGNSLWTKEFSGVQQVAVASDYSGPLIGVLSFGVALVKRGGLHAAWTTEATNVQQISVATDNFNGPLIGILQNGTALVKQGSLGNWVKEYSGVQQLAVASGESDGACIAVIDTNGILRAKQGSVHAAWVYQSNAIVGMSLATNTA